MVKAELRQLVRDLLKQFNDTSNPNDYLTNSQVDDALRRAEIRLTHDLWKLRNVMLYTREVTIAAVDEQTEYTLPYDVFDKQASSVRYGSTTTPLIDTTIDEIAYRYPTWRSTTSGTPQYVYFPDESKRKIGLYVKPNVGTATNIVLQGMVNPYAAGNVISTVVRSSNVTTVTTQYPHKLTTADTVKIYGVGDSTFDTASTAVASVPSTTTFTYANNGTNGSSTGGVVGYVGGILPMYADGDAPGFDETKHDIIAYLAAYLIGITGKVNGDQAAVAAATAAKAEYEALLAIW